MHLKGSHDCLHIFTDKNASTKKERARGCREKTKQTPTQTKMELIKKMQNENLI